MLTTTGKPAEFQAQGMKGTLVAADWPPLTTEELHPILRRYLLDSADLHLLSASPRPFSAAGIVTTPQGPVFIKRQSRRVRDEEGLCEEHRFIEYLRSKGIPAPGVLRTLNGSTVAEAGNWVYEVHQIPAGIDLYSDRFSWTPFLSQGHARSAGRMLAKLHLAAGEFSAPVRKPQPLVASFNIFSEKDLSAALKRYLADRPALAGYPALAESLQEALRLLQPFHRQLRPWLEDLQPLWTHNDLHGSNLLWSSSSLEAEAVAVIDFGLSDRTNAVYDLAQAIDRSIVEWLKLPEFQPGSPSPQIPVHLDHLEAMLTGYEEIRPLSRSEALALAPMTALGHAEFALSEADYFYGVLHSAERAAYACPDYLCGHARWFLGPEGQRLLGYLEARARRSGRRSA